MEGSSPHGPYVRIGGGHFNGVVFGEELAQGKDRGFKTHLVNYAIDQAIKNINSNNEQ
jgi:hypothetical protein